MRGWKTIGRRKICDFGRFLTVESHRVELPDGRVVENWPWLIAPDYAVVFAITSDGRVPIFRQTKYAVSGHTLAPPGGYLEAGETPEQAARRELLEETGCEASAWRALGSFAADSNRGVGVAHLFLAGEARIVRAPASDDLEEVELLWLDRAAVERALDAGEFKCLPWAALVALALRHWTTTGAV